MKLPQVMESCWEPRRASLHECADQLVNLATHLAQSDPLLEIWYLLGKSRKEALRDAVNLRDRDVVLDWLSRGAHREDAPPRRIMEDLGWSQMAWNGKDHEGAASLAIHVGCYSEYLFNDVKLEVKSDSSLVGDLSIAAACVKHIAETFDPLWVSFHHDLMPDDPPGYSLHPDMRVPPIGWVMYLSSRGWGDVNSAAAHKVQELPGLGHLVIMTRKPLDMNDPEHFERAATVERELGIEKRWYAVRHPLLPD